ncbi:YqcI/YcgG family protein [Marinospirillum insulare]|uniref:YqcI/YcgG family protein n=1 Tax=Marinospirillum insulare TaxID=217169 RepID=A0ABQ5ZSV8_9GAMM|nr:YqcI/YcgG family protein [Marinospirillum insulare]GLR63219.1 hypothetical protein GCM10007878_06540 [Marinospirillum insulare]
MLTKDELKTRNPVMHEKLCNFFNSDIFPCLFAKASFNKGYMLFCTFNDLDDFEKKFYSELLEYTKIIKMSKKRGERSYLTGVFIIEKEHHFINDFDFMVSTLKNTHKKDRGTWPKNKTKDMNSQDFDFYYNDIKLFPVITSPSHTAKIRVSPYLMIAIQPGQVFDFNKSERTEFYNKMRQSIHKKIDEIYCDEKPYYLSSKSSGKNIYQFAGIDPTEYDSSYTAPKLK